MLRWPDGRVRPLLFDASPLLPSAVYAPSSGALVVGADALRHARFDPPAWNPIRNGTSTSTRCCSGRGR